MTARLNFWIDAEIEDRLRVYAEDNAFSMAEAARKIINEKFGKEDRLGALENRIDSIEKILSSNVELTRGAD